jgi:predicted HicB family RNase H-like nuclease
LGEGGRPSLGPRVATSVRIPEALHERLVAAADERDVSVNYLVTKAVDRYLASLTPPPP